GPPGVAETSGARPELMETLRAGRQTYRRTRHLVPSRRAKARRSAAFPSLRKHPLAEAPPIPPSSRERPRREHRATNKPSPAKGEERWIISSPFNGRRRDARVGA